MADSSEPWQTPPPPRGILRAPVPDGVLIGRRAVPSGQLAARVHHFWSLRWALHAPYVAEALPHPALQILSRDGRAQLLGVRTGRLSRTLDGEGRMFGVAFRPAMLQLHALRSMAELNDRMMPLEDVLGESATQWARAVSEASDPERQFALTETFLNAALPPAAPDCQRLRDVAEQIARDRSLLRSADLSALSGLDARALQRWFKAQIGVSPKWMIQRYRLLEAAVQLASVDPPPLSVLALALGYADQAHFGRDFRRVIGQTPRAFMRAERAQGMVAPPRG